MAEEKEEKGFRVSDRRRFTGEGDHRATEDQGKKAASGQAGPSQAKTEAGPAPEQAPKEKTDKQASRPSELPEVNFATFIFSLSTSVLIHLGVTPDPVTGEQQQNLPFAKQTIDILAMLQEKTKGNLSTEEQQLMTSLLYDLRMQYVAASKKGR